MSRGAYRSSDNPEEKPVQTTLVTTTGNQRPVCLVRLTLTSGTLALPPTVPSQAVVICGKPLPCPKHEADCG